MSYTKRNYLSLSLIETCGQLFLFCFQEFDVLAYRRAIHLQNNVFNWKKIMYCQMWQAYFEAIFRAENWVSN